MTTKTWWRQAKRRWKAKTTKFAASMKKFAIWLITISSIVVAVIKAVEEEGAQVPNFITYIFVALDAYGIATLVNAKLDTADPEVHAQDEPTSPQK